MKAVRLDTPPTRFRFACVALWTCLPVALGFLGCVEHAAVGKNEVYCASEDDCPSEVPLCETELSVCRQCFLDEDCPGAEPDCVKNVCVCATADDCHEGLSCVSGKCDLD